ncbi:embryo defective 3006 [Carex rostrata]
MEAENSSSVRISARHQILKKLFKSEGVRRLLVPSSREDFNKAFEGFTEAEKDTLYHLFQNIVVESLPYNIERALDKICDVAKVGSILSKVEHIIEEQSLDVLYPYTGDLQEKIITVKKDEIATLKNLLEKVKKSNNEMRSRLDELKKNKDLPSMLDAVEKLRRWNAEFENCMGTSNQHKI